MVNSSWTISHVNIELNTNVSETFHVSIIRVEVILMSISISTRNMDAEEISETVSVSSTMTRQISIEDFSAVISSLNGEAFTYITYWDTGNIKGHCACMSGL